MPSKARSLTHTMLKDSHTRAAPGAKSRRLADPEVMLEVTIKVRRQNPVPLSNTYPQEQLPKPKIGKRYGASQEDIDAVAAEMERRGMTVIEKSCATHSLDVRGTVQQMEDAFDVRLRHYSYGLGSYRGRTGHISVPNHLAGIIEGVFGLDERTGKRPRSFFSPLSSRALTALPDPTKRPWFLPAELAKLFNFLAGDGKGRCVGLAEFGGGFFLDDLKAFCHFAQKPVPNVKTVGMLGTPVDAKDGAEGESMLDVEVVAGVLSLANIVMYFSQFTERGWIKLLDVVMQDTENNPDVLSVSWGFAELQMIWSQMTINHVRDSINEAALHGITICVATGDDGSADQVDDGLAHCDFPATAEGVWAIGGIRCDKNPDGTVTFTVWKDGSGERSSGGGSTGGGVSEVVPKPDYQKNVTVTSVNPGAMEGRIIPDVVFVASAETGYFVVVDGQPGVSGGTSAGTPFAAVLIALLNAALSRRVGFITPFFYQVSSDGQNPVYKIVCIPITKGDNVTATAGGYFADPDGNFSGAAGGSAPDGEKTLAELRNLHS